MASLRADAPRTQVRIGLDADPMPPLALKADSFL